MSEADGHDVIRVFGARVNNLRDVCVVVPKRRLTVFTGVSGSGKSSLVFGVIAAESQRLINETYSSFVQGFMREGRKAFAATTSVQLKACSSCGYPTTGDVCGFCRLQQEVQKTKAGARK